MFGYTFYRGHILKKRRNLKRDASMAMALWFYRQKLGPADSSPGLKENDGKERFQNSGPVRMQDISTALNTARVSDKGPGKAGD